MIFYYGKTIMFDMLSDSELELPQLSPLLEEDNHDSSSCVVTTSDESDNFGNGSLASGSPVSSPNITRVFGSLTVDRNSSTPYTDATQVRVQSFISPSAA